MLQQLAVHAACRYGQPLRLVVAQCEARWFLQELQVSSHDLPLCQTNLLLVVPWQQPLKKRNIGLQC